MEFDSGAMAVRAALAEVRAALAMLAVGTDAAGSVELVLAEVLNNICEHAYEGAAGGRIRLSLWARGDLLLFETSDDGAPMPEGRPPLGSAVDTDARLEDLPEGGFGWYMIRNLTTELDYARDGGRNRLSFCMRRDGSPHCG